MAFKSGPKVPSDGAGTPPEPNRKEHLPPRSHLRWPGTTLHGHFCTSVLTQPPPGPPTLWLQTRTLPGPSPKLLLYPGVLSKCSPNRMGPTVMAGVGEAWPTRAPPGTPTPPLSTGPPIAGLPLPPPPPRHPSSTLSDTGQAQTCQHSQGGRAISRRPQPWPRPAPRTACLRQG